MQKSIATSLIAAMAAALANGPRMSDNECLAEEGAEILEECFGMYMNLCHELSILPWS